MWAVKREPNLDMQLAVLARLELLLEDAESYTDLPDWMTYPELLQEKMMERVKLRKEIRALKKELNMEVL